jgi:hypothetical protein
MPRPISPLADTFDRFATRNPCTRTTYAAPETSCASRSANARPAAKFRRATDFAENPLPIVKFGGFSARRSAFILGEVND